jgi:hypothetical protein
MAASSVGLKYVDVHLTRKEWQKDVKALTRDNGVATQSPSSGADRIDRYEEDSATRAAVCPAKMEQHREPAAGQ